MASTTLIMFSLLATLIISGNLQTPTARRLLTGPGSTPTFPFPTIPQTPGLPTFPGLPGAPGLPTIPGIPGAPGLPTFPIPTTLPNPTLPTFPPLPPFVPVIPNLPPIPPFTTPIIPNLPFPPTPGLPSIPPFARIFSPPVAKTVDP